MFCKKKSEALFSKTHRVLKHISPLTIFSVLATWNIICFSKQIASFNKHMFELWYLFLWPENIWFLNESKCVAPNQQWLFYLMIASVLAKKICAFIMETVALLRQHMFYLNEHVALTKRVLIMKTNSLL